MKTKQNQENELKEVRSISQEAYIYGFPLLDNMRVQFAYFVDKENPEYKGPYNTLVNTPRVYTPEDKAIQTPNSDTPYSWLGLDLRAEPIVFSAPTIENERYWSLQLVDLYTHNFAYLGSRTTGNNGGSFAIAGPDWKGEIPQEIKQVIRCETQLAFCLLRTQLYDPNDLENVKMIQQQYQVQPLSEFLNQATPATAPEIQFPKPLSPEEQKTSITFFELLNFYLQFCPVHFSEKSLMEKFAKINIGAGKNFDAARLSPERKEAIENGMADAWKTFEANKKANIDTGKITAADGFGTREFLQNNYLYRMSSAVLGIYGNSKEEAIYPAYYTDSDGEPLNGANRYRLHFAAGKLPPANAFWSITMYELPASLLVSNPINRYLINSAMLPQLQKDENGGLTIYIQHAPPEPENLANLLPAPTGPFGIIMRIYWPKEEVLNGTWKQPAIIRQK